MRLLLAFLLLLPLRLLAAVGDITGAEVETNGWVIKLYVSGLNTNGYIYSGFGSLRDPTATNSIRLYCDSMGFDDAGGGIIQGRTVYGTKLLRRPTPNEAFYDVVPNGDGCLVRVALSDYIFQLDSNLTLNTLTGAYAVTNGDGTNSTVTSALSITNGSTLTYPKVIAHWTWPGFQRWSTETNQVRAVAFHWSAREGRPVRSVAFTVTTTNGISRTNWQTGMSLDRTFGDAIPFGEYVGQLSCADATNGAVVRCDFIAYPWIGDVNSTMNTWGNAYTGRDPNPRSQTNLVDRLGTYGVSYAVVDAVGGNDGTAFITNSFNIAGPPLPYLTIAEAEKDMASSNNTWYSRNDLGAGVIYLTPGFYHWADQHSAGTLPATWTTFAGYPTNASRTLALLTNTADTYVDNNSSARFRITNVTVRGPSAIFYNTVDLWFDSVDFNHAGTYLEYTDAAAGTSVYCTRSTISNLTQGLRAYGANKDAWVLIRGNAVYSATARPTQCYTVVGNYGKLAIDSHLTSIATPNADFPIAYNNRSHLLDGATAIKVANDTTIVAGGAAIVQNVVESTNGTTLLVGLSADGIRQWFTNALVWYNTAAGERINMIYDDTGSTSAFKVMACNVGNLWDTLATKSDTFTVADANRIGNWSFVYGVGHRSDIDMQTVAIGSGFSKEAGSYNLNGWAGVSSRSTSGDLGSNWVRYIDGQSYGRGVLGNGDYRIHTYSPAHGYRMNEWLLPFSIDGQARGRSDPPGAHCAGNPRKGSMF